MALQIKSKQWFRQEIKIFYENVIEEGESAEMHV